MENRNTEDGQGEIESRFLRQAARRDRLDYAISSVESLLEFMPLVMRAVEFKSRLSPPLTDPEIREMFQSILDRSAELQDAAQAFKCFCECQHSDGEKLSGE